MVLSLSRIFTIFERRNSRKSLPMLELMALSDHHLDDLNLPAAVKDAVKQQRGNASKFKRW